jgi:hypothetical protein
MKRVIMMTRRHGVLGGPRQQLPIRPRKQPKVNVEDEPKNKKSNTVEIITIEDIDIKPKEEVKEEIDSLGPVIAKSEILFSEQQQQEEEPVLVEQSILFSTVQIPEEIVDIKKEEKPKKKKRKYKRRKKTTEASEGE